MSVGDKEATQMLSSVNELRAAKQELEADIAKRLYDFEVMSGMTIDDLEIHREQILGESRGKIFRVEVVVKL